MRAEPPRFMACMRLLRGIELDHVQELMQVPAHFWRLYLGGVGKVWLDSDVEMRLYRVRAVLCIAGVEVKTIESKDGNIDIIVN